MNRIVKEVIEVKNEHPGFHSVNASGEEMQHFKDYIDARVCYEEYRGECYLNKEELVVICSMPDDSGAWVDDEDGNEKFVKIKDLFVSAYKMELINTQRNNYI